MPAMKVTPDAAMRARDVSRPHAEHVAQAEEAEASAADAAGVPVAAGGSAGPGAAVEAGVATEAEVALETDMTGGARRRRVRGARSSSRRGRPSRG